MTFDYIIVGAGSAGCVLAHRLSENPAHRVLLLEAGGSDKKFNIQTPAAYSRLHHSKQDWAFSTSPQAAMDGRVMHQPRGKVLGGCSSTNAMAYIRGNKKDYDDWAALGNKGWSYEEVLPYFKKAEHNVQFDNAFHGKNGPLYVSAAQNYVTPLGQAFIDACGEKGIPANADFNGEQQEGAGLFQFTIKAAKRHNTVAAYLKEAMKRPNLRVISKAYSEKILLEAGEKGLRATGVVFRKGGKKREVFAEKEVILSAGTFNSPHLLLLSGIGPQDQLSEFGIELKKELPGVGQNLQDHLISSICSRCNQSITFNSAETPGNLLKYLFTQKGPFTASPLEACAFVKTKPDLDRPDMQLHFAPAHGTDMHDVKSIIKGDDGYTILPTLITPKSVGEVRLQSADPAVPIAIDPRYGSHPDDLETLLRGMRLARELMHTQAFAPYSAGICFPEKHDTDEELLAHIRAKTESCYHPVGTCKMGADGMAVVDDQLRVHGLTGLRVADASIMPRIVAGNTNAPVIMIAEKAADLILGKGGREFEF